MHTEEDDERNPSIIHARLQVISDLVNTVSLPFLHDDAMGRGMSMYENEETVKKALIYAQQLQQELMAKYPDLMAKQEAVMSSVLTQHAKVSVTSVNPEVTEADLHTIFSTFGPVKRVEMVFEQSSFANQRPSTHKGNGWIEFECVESALMAVGSVELAGREVRICRMPALPTIPKAFERAPAERVFLSNASTLLSDSDLAMLMQTIGPIVSMKMNDHAHGRYGHVQFEKEEDAGCAAMIMDNFEIAGRRLRCCRAFKGGELPRLITTIDNVIVIRNLASPEDVATEQDRLDLLNDCLSECQLHGSVQSSQLIMSPGGSVNLYVHYNQPDQAQSAVAHLHNRWFGGRQLIVEYYDYDKFIMRDFT